MFRLKSSINTAMCSQEKELHAKEEALKHRDIALQDSLLRFSKFLQVWTCRSHLVRRQTSPVHWAPHVGTKQWVVAGE